MLMTLADARAVLRSSSASPAARVEAVAVVCGSPAATWRDVVDCLSVAGYGAEIAAAFLHTRANRPRLADGSFVTDAEDWRVYLDREQPGWLAMRVGGWAEGVLHTDDGAVLAAPGLTLDQFRGTRTGAQASTAARYSNGAELLRMPDLTIDGRKVAAVASYMHGVLALIYFSLAQRTPSADQDRERACYEQWLRSHVSGSRLEFAWGDVGAFVQDYGNGIIQFRYRTEQRTPTRWTRNNLVLWIGVLAGMLGAVAALFALIRKSR
jgi:hypothetical protein